MDCLFCSEGWFCCYSGWLLGNVKEGDGLKVQNVPGN